MTGPLVSIVTPVLNRVATIGACIESVRAQTYWPVEHIIVDGGSTDGTLDVLRRESTSSHLRWISGRDNGMYDAVNKGIALAQGDVLAYLNSDDLYVPWTIATACTGLEHGHDLLFGDLAVLVDDEERSSFYVQFYRGFDLRHYTHHGTIAQPTVFLTRELAERIGPFDASYALLGDCEYWLRAGVSGARITHVDEILAIQVEHAGTLRATRPDELAAEFLRLRDQYRAAAGPPRTSLFAGGARRLRWRQKQLELLIASRRRNGRKWRRFVSQLQSAGVEINSRYLLWHLLPKAIRPETVSLVDVSRATAALVAGGRR